MFNKVSIGIKLMLNKCINIYMYPKSTIAIILFNTLFFNCNFDENTLEGKGKKNNTDVKKEINPIYTFRDNVNNFMAETIDDFEEKVVNRIENYSLSKSEDAQITNEDIQKIVNHRIITEKSVLDQIKREGIDLNLDRNIIFDNLWTAMATLIVVDKSIQNLKIKEEAKILMKEFSSMSIETLLIIYKYCFLNMVSCTHKLEKSVEYKESYNHLKDFMEEYEFAPLLRYHAFPNFLTSFGDTVHLDYSAGIREFMNIAFENDIFECEIFYTEKQTKGLNSQIKDLNRMKGFKSFMGRKKLPATFQAEYSRMEKEAAFSKEYLDYYLNEKNKKTSMPYLCLLSKNCNPLINKILSDIKYKKVSFEDIIFKYKKDNLISLYELVCPFDWDYNNKEDCEDRREDKKNFFAKNDEYLHRPELFSFIPQLSIEEIFEKNKSLANCIGNVKFSENFKESIIKQFLEKKVFMDLKLLNYRKPLFHNRIMQTMKTLSKLSYKSAFDTINGFTHNTEEINIKIEIDHKNETEINNKIKIEVLKEEEEEEEEKEVQIIENNSKKKQKSHNNKHKKEITQELNNNYELIFDLDSVNEVFTKIDLHCNSSFLRKAIDFDYRRIFEGVLSKISTSIREIGRFNLIHRLFIHENRIETEILHIQKNKQKLIAFKLPHSHYRIYAETINGNKWSFSFGHIDNKGNVINNGTTKSKK